MTEPGENKKDVYQESDSPDRGIGEAVKRMAQETKDAPPPQENVLDQMRSGVQALVMGVRDSYNQGIDHLAGRHSGDEILKSVTPQVAHEYDRGRKVAEDVRAGYVDPTGLSDSDKRALESYNGVRSAISKLPVYDQESLLNYVEKGIHEKARSFTPARDSDATPPDRHATPPDRQAQPPEKQALPPDRHATPQDRHATPPDRNATPPDRNATPPEKQAPPPEKQALPPDKHAPPPDRNAPPPEKQATPPDKQATPPEKQALPPAKHALPPDRNATPPEKQATPPDKHALPPDRALGDRGTGTSTTSVDWKASAGLPYMPTDSSRAQTVGKSQGASSGLEHSSSTSGHRDAKFEIRSASSNSERLPELHPADKDSRSTNEPGRITGPVDSSVPISKKQSERTEASGTIFDGKQREAGFAQRIQEAKIAGRAAAIAEARFPGGLVWRQAPYGSAKESAGRAPQVMGRASEVTGRASELTGRASEVTGRAPTTGTPEISGRASLTGKGFRTDWTEAQGRPPVPASQESAIRTVQPNSFDASGRKTSSGSPEASGRATRLPPAESTGRPTQTKAPESSNRSPHSGSSRTTNATTFRFPQPVDRRYITGAEIALAAIIAAAGARRISPDQLGHHTNAPRVADLPQHSTPRTYRTEKVVGAKRFITGAEVTLSAILASAGISRIRAQFNQTQISADPDRSQVNPKDGGKRTIEANQEVHSGSQRKVQPGSQTKGEMLPQTKGEMLPQTKGDAAPSTKSDAAPSAKSDAAPSAKSETDISSAATHSDSNERQDESVDLARRKVLKRPTVLVGVHDTLVSIAEQYRSDANQGWLIADLNRGRIKETLIGNKRIVEVRSRQELVLPVDEDRDLFYRTKSKDATPENLITIVLETAIDKEVLELSLAPLLQPDLQDITVESELPQGLSIGVVGSQSIARPGANIFVVASAELSRLIGGMGLKDRPSRVLPKNSASGNLFIGRNLND